MKRWIFTLFKDKGLQFVHILACDEESAPIRRLSKVPFGSHIIQCSAWQSPSHVVQDLPMRAASTSRSGGVVINNCLTNCYHVLTLTDNWFILIPVVCYMPICAYVLNYGHGKASVCPRQLWRVDLFLRKKAAANWRLATDIKLTL